MTNRKIKAIAIIGVMIMLVAALAGCGKPTTLQGYLESDESAMQEIDDLAKNMNMEINVTDNQLTFNYALPEEVDEDSMDYYSEAFTQMEESLQSQMVEVVKQLEKETGIDGITVEVNYVDKAGNSVYKATFNNEGKV